MVVGGAGDSRRVGFFILAEALGFGSESHMVGVQFFVFLSCAEVSSGLWIVGGLGSDAAESKSRVTVFGFEYLFVFALLDAFCGG